VVLRAAASRPTATSLPLAWDRKAVEQSIAKGQSADSWRDGFAQSVEDRRRATRERISEQRKRLQEFDSQLTAKLDETAAQLAAAQQVTASSSASSKERDASLKEWQLRLEERERQFERKRAELEADRERLQTSLQEQLEFNRRQAETSREETLRHAAQLEQARQDSREEIEQLRSAAIASRENEAQTLSKQIAPLLAKLTAQETLLSEMNSSLEKQAAQKSSSLPAETAAEMAALRQENKSLAARLKETHGFSEQIEPLLARLAEQDATLSEMSRKLDEQVARKKSSAMTEMEAQLTALREENKALVTRLDETHLLSEVIEPLLARLAEQEAMLGDMSRKLDQQAAQKAPCESPEIAAELAALREENKSLVVRQMEAAAIGEQIKPLLARLTEQESMLSEMSRMLDTQVSQKTSSLPAETAAEMAVLRQENKSLAARLKETHTLSEQIEPLLARLAEQEAMLVGMSRKQDEEAARKNSDAASEMVAQLTALREENKSLITRHNETAALSVQIEPLLSKLAEQEATLAEMSRKLDDETTRKRSSATADAQLIALREENKALSARLHETNVLSERLEPLLARLAEQDTLLSEMSRKLDEDAVRRSSSVGPVISAELAALREENRSLEARLAAAEKAASAGAGSSGGGPDADDLRRRFEMAVQDVRELKTKNTELTEQLSKAKQSATAAGPAEGEITGWESLKKKLLSELETDFDENDSQQKADKLTVQGAIKITDDVVAEKERELVELRRVLDNQAQQVGEMAVGAAAVAQLLDTDELVRQERESLKRLQDSLREQLRQAEVDLSLERAKLGRERTELEERMRTMEMEKAQSPVNTGDTTGDKNKPAKGRKWLARLGLGENKDEQG
jgi:hypothetical protein